MPAYVAYGLKIRSDLSLPTLIPARVNGNGHGTDVDIRLEKLNGFPSGWQGDHMGVRLADREVEILWGDTAIFLVRNGREVLVELSPGADADSVQAGLLGPAFAALLQQRGFLILHASAIATKGAAVAFLGASGSGKSTLAAVLHSRGYTLVVDDIVAVRSLAGVPRIYAGFPHLKLWPESVLALGGDPEALPQIEPDTPKRRQPIATGFWLHDPLPLRQIYVLSRGEKVAIEPLGARDAFLELTSHSYGIHWLHQASGPAHFFDRAELAKNVPVRRLSRPWDLNQLSDVIQLLEEDFAAAS